eukprot:754043-Hanusia_phi.AAC.1
MEEGRQDNAGGGECGRGWRRRGRKGRERAWKVGEEKNEKGGEAMRDGNGQERRGGRGGRGRRLRGCATGKNQAERGWTHETQKRLRVSLMKRSSRSQTVRRSRALSGRTRAVLWESRLHALYELPSGFEVWYGWHSWCTEIRDNTGVCVTKEATDE